MQDRFEDAREIFFSQHPELLAEVEAVGASELDAIGVDRDHWIAHLRSEIFAAAAKARGLEPREFVIRLVAQSPEEAHEWRLADHRRTAEILGIEWDDYKKLNNIIE